MSETGDTNIEHNIGTSKINLPGRYNDTKASRSTKVPRGRVMRPGFFFTVFLPDRCF